MGKILFYFVIIIALCSCKKDDEVGIDKVPGKFSFSRIESLKSLYDDSVSISPSFNLDSLKSSKSFYFVLSNVGQEDIMNIVITTNNNNFKVSLLISPHVTKSFIFWIMPA